MRMWMMLLSLLAMVALSMGSAAADKEAVDESLNCLGTQTSGSGEKLFQTCVSDTGSVPLFRTRQGGGDNIASDGYMICDDASGGYQVARAWSRGSTESNFSFPTTRTSTSNVRTTADGRYRLTQNFARDTVEKDMVITMTLKNLGPGTATHVWLTRYVDIDADGNAGGNIFFRTIESVAAMPPWPGGERGMLVGMLTPEIPHAVKVTTYTVFDSTGFDSCVPFPATETPTSQGDYVAYISFDLGNLAVGAAKTVKIYYRRF